MTVGRRYYACAKCGLSQTPLDQWAGLSNRMASEHARRVIVVAGSAWSFEQASAKLQEMCRMRVSNDTIRAECDEEGARAGRWARSEKALAGKMAKAAGELEFSSDGMKINTVNGWAEMRLSVLDKRESAAAAEPEQWADRVLPEPTARLAWCQIAPCRLVGARWAAMFKHLGIGNGALLSVIADGAKWIWEQAGLRLPAANASWVVDVYHVSEHLHDCGKLLLGEGAAARAWAEEKLTLLLDQSGPEFVRHIEQLSDEPLQPGQGQALNKLLVYLRDNLDRMWYRQRLAAGRPIGSGLIEGGCKTILGARLKLNSARWQPRRAERMGNLRCLQYSDLWDSYWNVRTAA